MVESRQESIRNQIVRIFEESGIVPEFNENGDADLSVFVEDSLHFITMVVSLEAGLNIEFPDELLVLEAFQSLNALAYALAELPALLNS